MLPLDRQRFSPSFLIWRHKANLYCLAATEKLGHKVAMREFVLLPVLIAAAICAIPLLGLGLIALAVVAVVVITWTVIEGLLVWTGVRPSVEAVETAPWYEEDMLCWIMAEEKRALIAAEEALVASSAGDLNERH
ncbi:hypothetical protein [Sphingomonas sp. TZW2008]|uniref:hypothetical protein n=1 Tax=Sphingomonas sp. TZW2008 TaxID=1917973 RepID=UPI000A26FB2D